jgi:hypothetical protein
VVWSPVGLSRFKTALRVPDTADDTQLLRDLEMIGDLIERECDRRFQPYLATVYLSYDPHPDAQYRGCLMLPRDLLAVTSLKTASDETDGVITYGDTWAGSGSTVDYRLEPRDAPTDRRPYWRIRATGTRYSWPCVNDGIELIGTFGYWLDTISVGTLGAAIADTTTTSVTMTAGHSVEAGHTLLIDSEQFYVSAVSTNTLTVERGVNGTTAAAHLINAAVSRFRYPAVVEDAGIHQAQLTFRGHDAPFGAIGGGEWNQEVRSQFLAGLHPTVKRELSYVSQRGAI